jgi:nitrate reductase NapE component
MKSKETSNKSFGILFFFIFLAIGIWPLFSSGDPRLWSLVFSFVFLVLGLLNSKILKPIKDSWIKFGEILGKFIAPIIMAAVFFIILTPTGLLLRIFGKDLLKTKYSKDSSYWIHRSKDIGSMKKQF